MGCGSSSKEVSVPGLSPVRHASEERKRHVLTQGTPSVTRAIADAVVIKDGDLFLLVEPDGRVPGTSGHGLGLYFQDCRYLRTYEVTLAGVRPVPLGSSSAPGHTARFELTNPELGLPDGSTVPQEVLGIRWEHQVVGPERLLSDRFTVQNWSAQPVRLPVEFRFDAGFEDVFEVRGLVERQDERTVPSEWKDGDLRFSRVGRDQRKRSLVVSFDGASEPSGDSTAALVLELRPREIRNFSVKLTVSESPRSQNGGRNLPRGLRSPRSRVQRYTRIQTDNPALNAIIQRSFSDLRLLTSDLDGQEFFAAGLPWFGTLFGRDSIVSALQVLPFNQHIAEPTLRLLARFQGERVDEWRDEQPGKILHELRVGELAASGAIPHTPYYGTVDATPLFLLLLSEHARWSGDLGLFQELEPNVRRALDWIDHYGDIDGDGYVEYQSSSEHGLINQGWKDSGDAILDADGKLAEPPIALAEVQGYVYQAKLAIAELYARDGQRDQARRLRIEANRLGAAFNRDFWVQPGGYFALALEAGNRRLEVMSSNAGQVLWSGIADAEHAAEVAAQLFSDEMFSGWGVRTLSRSSRGYNPIGYHLGTVWPHDNSIIAAGLRRYRHDHEASRIFEGIVQAAMQFEHKRLPELFTGFSREDYDEPVRYPVACHPQAWAAGSVPFLLHTSLGLQADAAHRRLKVVRPMLPPGSDRVELRELEVGRDKVSLRFIRQPDGGCAVEPQGRSEIEVIVVPEGNEEETEGVTPDG